MSGGHGGHGAIEGENKYYALLIAIMALMLAFTEAGGKQAQSEMLAANIEASNLWSFFQAKTIRGTTLRTAVETLEIERDTAADAGIRAAMDKRINDWKATIARYDSEPDTNEGRKELMVRAKAKEVARDLAHARDGKFEIASGAFQLGIVLISAAIITGMAVLVWLGGLFGIVGVVFGALALFAPLALFH